MSLFSYLIFALMLNPFSQAHSGSFEAELDSLRREHAIPGMSAAVVQNGEVVWARGFGVSNIDEAVRVTPDTPFWIASVTKTFVGLTLLSMEDDGVLDLDDPMSSLPEFDSFCEWLANASLPFSQELDCTTSITVRNVLTHTSNGDVGHAFLYNPILYSRLARYIEWVVNDSTQIEGGTNELARQVEARILSPAGMNRTMASQWDRSKMDVEYDMARGYGVEGEGALQQWVLRPPPKRALTAGAGIISTALDLGRYIEALSAGSLASTKAMNQLLVAPLTRDGTALPYAHGWYVQELEGQRLAWHGGWDPEFGFSSLLIWLPDQNAGFALLANGEGANWDHPLDGAAIEDSEFGQAFLSRFVLK